MRRENFRKSQIQVGAWPQCEICKGSGYRMYDTEQGQRTRPCECWLKVALAKNLKLTWPYMAKQVKPVSDSPLCRLDREKKFAIITASQRFLAAHLKGCMITHGIEQDDPCWWVEVSSDKDIIEAWLYTARLKGDEIYDADLASSIFHADNPRSIKELAMTSDLMVIQLGKKIAPNKETDTTFIEALEYRIDNNLLTWITLTPRRSLEELQADSDDLRAILEDYEFEDVVLEAPEVQEQDVEDLVVESKPQQRSKSSVKKRAQSIVQNPGGRPMITMSQGSGGTTRDLDIDALLESSESKKKRAKREKNRR